MMQNFKQIKRFLSTKNFILHFIVLSLILAPISISLTPQKAEAAWPTFDGSNVVQTTITASESLVQSAQLAGLEFKEYVLDFGAWGLVNILLEAMLQSTIGWVNSGFDGKPMYITDLRGFMVDVTDYVVEDYLLEHLNLLCSPYMADIKMILELNYIKYERDYEVQCRLSDAVDNLEGFISGDFINAGGWEAWYEVALNPSNNIYGSVLEAGTAISARASNVNDSYTQTLDRSDNFLDIKKCDINGKNCKTTTPGNAINEQLNESLAIPGNRLTIGDELDELLGSLFTQLVNTALSRDAGGVYGLSNSSGANGSYFSHYAGQLEPETRTEHDVVTDVDQLREDAQEVTSEAAANAPTEAGGGAAGTNTSSPLEQEYMQLLGEAASVIRLCEGESIIADTRQSLDSAMDFITGEIQSIFSGNNSVSEGEVIMYRETTLLGITGMVATAGCN
jgi:hypothetical protein